MVEAVGAGDVVAAAVLFRGRGAAGAGARDGQDGASRLEWWGRREGGREGGMVSDLSV